MEKRVKNQEAVAHAWARNHEAGDAFHCGASMYSRGAVIFSYGPHFPIARYILDSQGQEIVIFNANSYSNTTAGHKSITRLAIPSYIPVFDSIGADPAGVLKHYTDVLADLADKLPRARKNGEYYRLQIEQVKHTIADYCARFGHELPAAAQTDTDPAEITRLVREDRAAAAAAELERRRLENEESAAREAVRLTEWLQGRGYGSFYYQAETYLRLSADGERVETSRNADLPVREARVLYNLIQRGGAIDGQTFGGYRVAYNDNRLQIGCHVITRAEIERFAASVGWRGGE